MNSSRFVIHTKNHSGDREGEREDDKAFLSTVFALFIPQRLDSRIGKLQSTTMGKTKFSKAVLKHHPSKVLAGAWKSYFFIMMESV